MPSARAAFITNVPVVPDEAPLPHQTHAQGASEILGAYSDKMHMATEISRRSTPVADQSKESGLSADDTCSTDASDDLDIPHDRSATPYDGYFDFHSLPDGSTRQSRDHMFAPCADNQDRVMKGVALSNTDRCNCDLAIAQAVCTQSSTARSNQGPGAIDVETQSAEPLEVLAAAGSPCAPPPTEISYQGCGFDFDDLPTLPSTFYEPHNEDAEAASLKAAPTAAVKAAQASTLGAKSEGCGFDFDDLPMLPHTLDDPRSDSPEAEVPTGGVPVDIHRHPSRSFRPPDSPTSSTRSSAASLTSEEEVRPLPPVPLQRRTLQGPPPWPAFPGFRVAIVADGSKGDLQPMIALAQQLVLFRHHVRIFCAANLVGMCQDEGLHAVPSFADSKAIIHEYGGFNNDSYACMTAGKNMARERIAEQKDFCVDVMASLKEFHPNVVICVSMSHQVGYMHEAKTGTPFIPVYLSTCALEAYKGYAMYPERHPDTPAIFPVSPLLENVSSPPPQNLWWTDEFVLHQVPSADELEPGGRLAELRTFLTAGKPPVAMGWGSMVASGMSPTGMLGLALRALHGAGARGVILGGWAGLDELASELQRGGLPELGEDAEELAAFAAEHVCFVNSAPHEWLFPHCCAVVHHGGVGTLHAAVRAGRPQVVTPIFADQFSHSACVNRAGVGLGFRKPLQELEAQELSNAISLVEAKRGAAEAIGQKMRAKVGERDAAILIDKYLRKKYQA